DRPGGHRRRLPDRVARPAADAAPDAPAQPRGPGGTGGDRPAGTDHRRRRQPLRPPGRGETDRPELPAALRPPAPPAGARRDDGCGPLPGPDPPGLPGPGGLHAGPGRRPETRAEPPALAPAPPDLLADVPRRRDGPRGLGGAGAQDLRAGAGLLRVRLPQG